MATFAPYNDDAQAQNFDRYSRGPGVNDTLGTLFKGIGNLGADVITAKDNQNKSNIDDNLRQQVEKTQTLFGTDAVTSASTDTVPSSLAKSTDKIAAFKQAYENGSISELHYYGNLNAIVKNARASYPGYEDYIDNKISQLTGVKPANAIVAQLREDAQKELAAKDSAGRDFTNFVQTSIAQVMQAMPDYFDNPGKYTQVDVYKAVGNIKAQNAQIESQTAKIGLLASQNKLDGDTAYATARDMAATIANQFQSGGFNVLGKDFTSLQSQINTLRDKGATPSPEDLAQMNNTFGKLKLAVSQEINKRLLSPINPSDPSQGTWAKYLTPEQMKDVTAQATQQIDALGDAINNGNYGFITANAAAIKAAQDQTGADLIKKFDIVKNLSAAKTILGDAGVATVMGSDKFATNMNELSIALKSNSLATVGTGKAQSVNSDLENLSNDMKNRANGIDQNLTKSILNDNVNVILDKKTNPEIAQNFVNYLFSKDNGLQINKLPANAQSKVYSLLTQPEMTKRIKAMDPGLFANYSKWASTQFINKATDLAASIKEDMAGHEGLVSAVFNTSTNQLELRASPSAQDSINNTIQGGLPGVGEAVSQRIIDKYRDFNTMLSGFAPLIKADGKDPSTAIPFVFERLGIPLTKAGSPEDRQQRSNDPLINLAPLPDSQYNGSLSGGKIDPVAAKDYLMQKGMTDFQSAALLGNIQQESDFRLNAYNAKEGAIGPLQWREDRAQAYQKFAAGYKDGTNNPQAALDFMLNEMGGAESVAGKRFLSSTTLEEANADLKKYIKYGDDSEGTRLSNARAFL
jgi:hypothetical protein